MSGFLLAFFTFILVLVCLFIILVILMQRPSASGGLGSAMGGGAVESALGVQTNSILAKSTSYALVVFFTLAFGLYLGFLKHGQGQEPKIKELPVLEGLSAPILAIPAETQAPALEQAPASAPAPVEAEDTELDAELDAE